MPKIKIKRGSLTPSSLDDGELYLANGGDAEGKLYAGTSEGDTNTDKVRVKYADNSTYASKIGNENSHSGIGYDRDESGHGSGSKGMSPVYVNESGEVVPASLSHGSGVNPIYMNNGAIRGSDSDVGDIHTPMFLSGGEMTPCTDANGDSSVDAAYATKIGKHDSHPQKGNPQCPIYINGDGEPAKVTADNPTVTLTDNNRIASFSYDNESSAEGLYIVVIQLNNHSNYMEAFLYISLDSVFNSVYVPIGNPAFAGSSLALFALRSGGTITLSLYENGSTAADRVSMNSCYVRRLYKVVG